MISLYLLADWRLYKKMGAKGWVCLIPVYSSIYKIKVVMGSPWYALLLLIPIINIFFLIVFSVKYVHAFGKKGWWIFGGLFFGLLVNAIFGISDFEFKNGSLVDRNDYDFIDGLFDFLEGQREVKTHRAYYATIEDNVCSNCGAELREDSKFCPQCGNIIK